MLARSWHGLLLLFALLFLLIRSMTRQRTMTQISKNFAEWEFNIDKSTPANVRTNVYNLVLGLLQPLRDRMGKPVLVGAGYRNHEQNKAAGGVSDSQHLTGQAADIKVRGVSPVELAKVIRENFKFDVLILYSPGSHKGYPKGGVHVSFVRGFNRNIFLTK
jgi:zinc D-Ala-D-Ala carboxypeptidase